MSTLEIQKNVKYINDYRNKPKEVIENDDGNF